MKINLHLPPQHSYLLLTNILLEKAWTSLFPATKGKIVLLLSFYNEGSGIK